MTAPAVKLRKLSAAAVAAQQAALGVLAIVAPCVGSAALPVNVPTPFSDTGSLQTACVEGPACEFGTYFINTAGNQCLVVRGNASIAGFDTNPSIPPVTIVAVTNGPPAVLQTSVPHGYATGDIVTITGAVGDTVINGTNEVTVIDPTHFSIPVTGSGAYTTLSATSTFNGVQYVGTGTAGSQVTCNAAAASDDYQVLLVAVAAGTTGVAGIVWQTSLDDGALFNAVTFAMGTGLTVTPTLPQTGASSGVVFTFPTGLTVNVGDAVSCIATSPRMSTADLNAALASLGTTAFGWDLVLVHGETSPTLVSAQDSWSTSLGPQGVFPFLISNTRHKFYLGSNPLVLEADPTFQTAMSTLLSTVSTINVCVGTDAADMPSLVSGVTKPMPTSLYIATRLEMVNLGVDAARVFDGSVPLAGLSYPNMQPKWHDEGRQGGLDSTTIRLSTLRTWSTRPGTYVTNAYILSGNGSVYVYAQHARTMNAACEAIFDELVGLMSQGYDRDPVTGLIDKGTALDWESRGQEVLDSELDGQVSGALFVVSQNDINLGNGPAKISCSVKVASLGYVKEFDVTTQFVQTLQ